MKIVYTKDHSKTESFSTYEAAKAAHEKLGPDTEERRSRVRLRQRTGTFDLVVKVRKEVES